MAAIGSIVVLELRLDQNAFVHNFILDCSNKSHNSVLFWICEVCSALWILNNANWICLITEYVIDIVAQLSVVDEARIANFVLLNKSIDLFFAKSQV